MPIPFLVSLAIGIALSYVAYLLAPKPKAPQPPEAKDFEAPTAEAGRPIPVIFGSLTITSINNLGHWDKETVRRDVPVDGGGKK